MNHHRMAAAIGALALLPTVMTATASTAQAQAARPAEHGCPGGDVCLYNSKAHYNNDAPDVVDGVKGIFFGGTFDLIAVNNTAATYSSQGSVVAHYKNGMLFFCSYEPDAADEQSPGITENPADDADITAMAAFDSAMLADSGYPLPLSDCET